MADNETAITDGQVRSPPALPPSGTHLNPLVGTVGLQIGTGENAQHAIVYNTIRWSFVAAGALSVAILAYSLLNHLPLPAGELRDIWAVFVPLITLALGYIFGKAK